MPGLLVSVRDTAEAVLALDNGAALIDVKEPDRGSLGPAPPEVVADVLAVIAGRCPVSAAQGELLDWIGTEVPPHAGKLSYIKWGLAGCRGTDWHDRLLALRGAIEDRGPCRVVLTAYADWRRAAAPEPAEVAHFAIQQQFAAILLDTWHKDGSSLLNWMSAPEVVELGQSFQAAGGALALAGSLGLREIRILSRHIEPDWFAVRGSVCIRSKRTAGLDPARVRQLAERLSHPDRGAD